VKRVTAFRSRSPLALSQPFAGALADRTLGLCEGLCCDLGLASNNQTNNQTSNQSNNQINK
jgi:hypothetical protein